MIVIVLVLGGCSSKRDDAANCIVEEYLLGADIILSVEGKNDQKACADTVQRISEIQNRMTIHNPGSEIMNINKYAGEKKVFISGDTFFVLEQALIFAELTGGSFDPTIGPLVKLWGIGTGNYRIPGEDEIREHKLLVDYHNLMLSCDGDGYTAYLPRKGQVVDLGAIAKGYAGDEARRILINHGIERGIINLGGNVVALGRKKDGSLWRVGIQNPMAPRGTYLGIVQVEDKAVVTSGGYERNFIKDGQRYHHIIDPGTGHPADSGLISVTIIAGQGVEADALSTGAYVLGLIRGIELIESLPGVEAIFITENKKIYTTGGIRDCFQLTDRDYSHEEI